MARSEHTHWWYTGMTAIAADWLKRLPAPAHGIVLDAGCGTGGNLEWLTQLGRACGVDMHPLALQLAAQHGCPWLVQADVKSLPFAAARFSIVTTFDVLCHSRVGSDWDAFRELARVLQPKGWLFVRLPAYNWLRGAHDLAVHTQHRYTCKEVSAKLQAAGLRPVRVSYANALLFPFAIIWRLLQRSTNSEPASDVRPLPPWLNRLLEWCLRAEGVWLRRLPLPFGLSVLALAQKEAA
ncbi:MAG: class I SAM-dependent methyltransferase [Verrucomicrobia bacterium]|nr:class I SAM-dependent methyltransferase [Verrucomicrobiota bacterium]